MWRIFKGIIRHRRARRIEAQMAEILYRTIERNHEALENGQELPDVDIDVIRRCGGFREYANDHIMGPIL